MAWKIQVDSKTEIVNYIAEPHCQIIKHKRITQLERYHLLKINHYINLV